MPCLDILSYLAFEVFRLEGVSRSVSEVSLDVKFHRQYARHTSLPTVFFFTLVGPCSCGVGENDGGQDLN